MADIIVDSEMAQDSPLLLLDPPETCRIYGHSWHEEGGRECGCGKTDHSEPVFRCSRPGCEAWDYGTDRGGPGDGSCPYGWKRGKPELHTLLREYWMLLAEAASKAAFPSERMKHRPGFIARDIQITEKGREFLRQEKHA